MERNPELDAAELQLLDLKIENIELANWKLKAEKNLISESPTARGYFHLFDGVDDATVYDLMQRMDTWSAIHPEQPITFCINCPGGSVISGNALYDFLLELKTRGHYLTTKCFGMAASMGGVLFQAGHERVISPRSWMLIHEVQGIVAGSFSEMEDDMAFNERLQKQALKILSERSTLSERAIKTKWKRKDWWMDAPEALKFGFADRIEE